MLGWLVNERAIEPHIGNPTVSRKSLKFANTYRRLASPADYERSLCQPVLNASDLRPLLSKPQSQQGVVSPGGGNTKSRKP